MKIKMKNILQRYNLNRPSSRHGHKYSKKCLSMTMVICIRQHVRDIWSSIHENLELIKSIAYKKGVHIFLLRSHNIQYLCFPTADNFSIVHTITYWPYTHIHLWKCSYFDQIDLCLTWDFSLKMLNAKTFYCLKGHSFFNS